MVSRIRLPFHEALFDLASPPSLVMDLAQGHVDALAGLTRDELFKEPTQLQAGTGFGGSGGKYRAFNLGRGKGMSVLQMVEAMRKSTGFDYKYEIVGRRSV